MKFPLIFLLCTLAAYKCQKGSDLFKLNTWNDYCMDQERCVDDVKKSRSYFNLKFAELMLQSDDLMRKGYNEINKAMNALNAKILQGPERCKYQEAQFMSSYYEDLLSHCGYNKQISLLMQSKHVMLSGIHKFNINLAAKAKRTIRNRYCILATEYSNLMCFPLQHIIDVAQSCNLTEIYNVEYGTLYYDCVNNVTQFL